MNREWIVGPIRSELSRVSTCWDSTLEGLPGVSVRPLGRKVLRCYPNIRLGVEFLACDLAAAHVQEALGPQFNVQPLGPRMEW